jgi:hypothetical protein
MRSGPLGWVERKARPSLPPVAWPIFCHRLTLAAAGGRTGSQLQAHQVGLALVTAAELEREQLPAQVGGQLPHVAQAQQLRAQAQAQVSGLGLGQALAGVLAQRGPFRGP